MALLLDWYPTHGYLTPYVRILGIILHTLGITPRFLSSVLDVEIVWTLCIPLETQLQQQRLLIQHCGQSQRAETCEPVHVLRQMLDM